MSEPINNDWRCKEVKGALLAIIVWNGRKAFMQAKWRDVNGEQKPELYFAKRRLFQSRQSVETTLRLTAIQDILSTTHEAHAAHCEHELAVQRYARALTAAGQPVPDEVRKWAGEESE